ncbi:parvulin-like peptidyl-prolyl isomerase [Paenibacillus anaericanus]|nr:parvulin-like peptidyl-prolyl isomerase [Paenibacillus anaericanus]
MAVLFAGVTVGLLLIGAITVKSSSNSVLLSVNGQETSSEEFRWHLNLNRALVADYFKQTYGAEYSDEFWTTPYSGETPLQKLVDEAKAQILRKQIEQQQAEQVEVASNISFEEFLNGMDTENARRIKAAANNEVVYGPIHLETQAYYSYYMSNLENAIMDAMIDNGMIVLSEEVLKTEYERNKVTKFTLPGEIDLEWATLSYGPESEYKDKQDAMERIKLLKVAVANGAGFREKAKELGVSLGEARITNASRRTAALDNPLILQTAEQLSSGQTSGIIEENEAVHLLHCTSVGEDTYQPFERVKDHLTLQLAQEAFRSTIERKLNEAVIKWNNSIAMSLAYKETH